MKHAWFSLILLFGASNMVRTREFDDGIQSNDTGFVVSRQGHILTNHHVVNGCASIRTVPNGHKKELTVVGMSPPQDERAEVQRREPER